MDNLFYNFFRIFELSYKSTFVAIGTLLGVTISCFLFFLTFFRYDLYLLWSGWLLVGMGILILGISISISMLLLTRKSFMLVWLAALLIFPAFFGLNFQYLAALILFFISLFWGFRIHLIEEKMRLKFQIHWILSRSLPIILTGLCFLIAMSYCLSPAFGELELKVEIPRAMFDKIWQLMSEDSVLGNISSLNHRNYGNASEALTSQQAQELAYQNLNNALNAWLDNLLGSRKKQYFSIAVVLGLFVGLKTLSIPLMWIIILLSWGVIKILRLFNFVKIEKRTIKQERLVLT